jgi:hypothetical protein
MQNHYNLIYREEFAGEQEKAIADSCTALPRIPVEAARIGI